ncbi:MAG: YigZ family protein, partial [Flavobacteriales bacterium]
GVIRANDLTHVLFAVVRYFGGTKLGVGGLIEAYREGASEALTNGVIVEVIRTKRLRIAFDYDQMGVVMGLIKRWDLEPVATDFQLSCSLDVDVRLAQVEGFVEAVEETRVAEISVL